VPGIGSESIFIEAPDSWRTWDIFEPFAPITMPINKNSIKFFVQFKRELFLWRTTAFN
jgi:hypothetical protein